METSNDIDVSADPLPSVLHSLDITEEELVHILDDDAFPCDTVSPYECGSRPTRRNKPTTVEILFDDGHGGEVERILDDVINNLNLSETVNFSLRNIIRNDLLLVVGTKLQMIEKYCQIMQNQYRRDDSDPEEIFIKKILITAVPRIMNLRLQARENPSSKVPPTLTSDDIEIIKYLSGAILRWGMNRLSGGDTMKWLSEQIAPNRSLAPRFECANKGHLIVPGDEFLQIMLEAEKQFRDCISHDEAYVDEFAIINSVCAASHIALHARPIVEKLIGRFVRLRVHIRCKRLTNEHMQLKMKKRRAVSLRKHLKQIAK